MTSGLEPLELPDEIVRENVPDDDIVLAYVTRGALARYVEGVAAMDEGFREELLACIDGLEEAGETVSAVARAWREPSAAVVPIHAVRRPNVLRRWAPIAVAAALVLGIGGYHHQQMEEARRVEEQKDRELAEAQAKLAQLQADLKAQQEIVAAAQIELVSAKSDADRANAQAKLFAAQEQQKAAAAKMGNAAAGAKPRNGAAKAACNCQPGDALCSCL